jgi:hypothetical protein
MLLYLVKQFWLKYSEYEILNYKAFALEEATDLS